MSAQTVYDENLHLSAANLKLYEEIARLQDAKRAALKVADERTMQNTALRQAATKLIAAMDDMHEKGETFTPRVSIAVAEMRHAVEQESRE